MLSSNRTSWVKTHGHAFKFDVGVIYDAENDLPVDGEVQDIYIIDGDKVLFTVNPYNTYYESHFHAYLLSERTDFKEKFFVFIKLVY